MGKQTKSKPLTAKQKGFVKDYIKTKNATEAVRRNYDLGSKGGTKTQTTATSIAKENLTKPSIQKALVRSGITRDFLAQELKENLELSKADKQYNTHLKGIELSAKLTGELQQKSTKTNINVIGYLDTTSLKELQKNSEVIEVE